MNTIELNQRIDTYKLLLIKLQEAYSHQAKALRVDATIKRFCYTYDLCCKILKKLLFAHGIDTGSPREAIKAAFKENWINDEAIWIQMLKDRNITSHTYHEETANQVYQDIFEFIPVLQKCSGLFAAKLGIIKNQG